MYFQILRLPNMLLDKYLKIPISEHRSDLNSNAIIEWKNIFSAFCSISGIYIKLYSFWKKDDRHS